MLSLKMKAKSVFWLHKMYKFLARQIAFQEERKWFLRITYLGGNCIWKYYLIMMSEQRKVGTKPKFYWHKEITFKYIRRNGKKTGVIEWRLLWNCNVHLLSSQISAAVKHTICKRHQWVCRIYRCVTLIQSKIG